MDFCVYGPPENVTLRAAYLINFQSQRDLFLIFHFLYPHPSILALKHRSRSVADCNSVQREKVSGLFTFHIFHPVANCLCSTRVKCVCEKIFETALQLKTKMLTICGKGLPNVIVCETKMLEQIFMHSVNCRKNDDVFEDFFKVHWAACNDVNHLFQRIPYSFSVSLIKGLKENSKITSL